MERRECLRLIAGAALVPGLAGLASFAEEPLGKDDAAFLEAMESAGPVAFLVKIDPEQTYFPKISSRIFWVTIDPGLLA